MFSLLGINRFVNGIPIYFHHVIFNIFKTVAVGLAFMLCNVAAHGQTSKVQFIHNCTDDSLGAIDVWVNGQLWASNLDLHQATSFQTAADTSVWSIRQAGDSSISYYSWNAQLAANSEHIFTLQGNLDSSSYSPFMPLTVRQFDGALEQSVSSSSIDVMFLHGTSDLDSIEIAETQLFQLTAFNDLAYGSYSGYLQLFTADYGWGIFRESDSSLIAEFALPVGDLSWAGEAITLVTSGYVNQRQNNSGESFGMWATTNAGGNMVKLEPLRWNINSEVQLVHNSAMPNSAAIEITCDGIPWQQQLNVHEASTFSPFPSGKEVEMCMNSILPNGQVEALWCDTLQLLSGQRYQLIWFGGDSPSNAPQLYTREWPASDTIASDSTEVTFFNGSASWPLLSISESAEFEFPLFENVPYSTLSNSVVLPNVETEWILSSDFDSLISLRAPLDSVVFAQQRITALSYSDTMFYQPSLWLCLPQGGPMIRLEAAVPPELPVYCQLQLVHTSADTMLSEVDIWLNDSLWFSSFEFETATPFISVACNDSVYLRVTPVGDSSNTLNETAHLLSANQYHRLFLWGIFDTEHYNPSPNLDWTIDSDISLTAENSNEFSLDFFHAATDLGDVDLNETTLPVSPLFSNITAGSLSSEATFTAENDLVFSLRNSPTQFLFGSYSLPVSALNLADSAVTLISSGFRQPANNSFGPPLKMWALLPSGEMNELLPHVGLDNQSQQPGTLTVFPNPCRESIRVTGNLRDQQMVSVQFFDLTGKHIETHNLLVANASKGLIIPTAELPCGVYFALIRSEEETHPLYFVKGGN
jgi:hypothetical protein